MTRNFLIRKIVTDDNSALAVIIRSSLKEFNANKPGTVYFDESTDHLSDIFLAPKSAYFVLEINDEVAGGGGFYPTEGLEADTCELVKMYLSKKYRGKGYGKMILEKCMKAAAEKGFTKMYIETMPELTDAIAMYQKNNFHFLPGPLGNSGHTGCDVWMLRML